MTVPGAGRPLAVNRPAGAVTEVTVSRVVPTLVIVTTAGSDMPTGTLVTETSVTNLNEREPGIADKPGLTPSPDRGTFTDRKRADRVAKEIEPAAPPGTAGEKVTGARSTSPRERVTDRKSTRLNSSHRCISYAVFCL